MEDYALARLHREALVTSIWEGSSNIQALDLLEAMHKKGAHEPFLDEFLPMLEKANNPAARQASQVLQDSLRTMATLSNPQAQWYAKDMLRCLADAAQVALLYSLSEAGGERYTRLAELYSEHFLLNKPYPAWALEDGEIWWPVSEVV
jgi:hypothetical protein